MNSIFRSAFAIIFLFFINAMAFSQTDSKKSLSLKTNYIDKKNMDVAVKPGDNFFLYANSNWIKNNPIPASKTRWGSFDELREESSKHLRGLLEEASNNTGLDRNTQIIGDFYSSGMDSIAIEKKGYEPIKAILDEINNINSIPGVLHEIAIMRVTGYGGAAFGVFVGPDRKNVFVNIPSIGQGGTSLPDRDYYLKDDARSIKIRNAYMQNLKTMFSLVGEDSNKVNTDAHAVMKIETRLAEAQMSRVELRDPYKTYNKFSLKDLAATTPNINWVTQVEQMQIKGADSVVINNPAFFKIFDSLLTALPLNDWKSYLRWTVIRNAAPNLSSSFVNADFELNRVLTGQKRANTSLATHERYD